jgi:hypothetical protein
MRLLLALLLPWLAFFTISRPIAGIVCLDIGLKLTPFLTEPWWS